MICDTQYFLRKNLLLCLATMASNSAEYQRKYRQTVKPMNERKAHGDGIEEGLARCVRYLRDRVAGRAVTGFQAALMIERAMLAVEPAETTARRQFIEALRGGQGEAKNS